MRLYDLIQQTAGTKLDLGYRGMIGNFAGALREAQCFELTPQVVTACGMVAASKPSSIIAARPMLRLPYQSIWIEWYGDRGDYMKNNTKIIPDRLGCLIASDGVSLNRGYAYWAWCHEKNFISVAPFGIAFDWDLTRPSAMDQLLSRFKIPQHLLATLSSRIGSVAQAQAILVNIEK